MRGPTAPGRGTGPPGGMGSDGQSGVLVPPGVDLLPPGVVFPVFGVSVSVPGRGTGPPGGMGRDGQSGVLVPPGVLLLPPGVVPPSTVVEVLPSRLKLTSGSKG